MGAAITSWKPAITLIDIGRSGRTSAFRETSDEGRPITLSAPETAYAQRFREIAARLWDKVAGADAPKRAPSRIIVE